MSLPGFRTYLIAMSFVMNIDQVRATGNKVLIGNFPLDKRSTRF